jgi:hypothetical protein
MALNVPHLNAEGFPQAAQPVVRSRWSPAEDQLFVDGMNNFQDIQALISKFEAVKNDDRFVAGLANRSSVAMESRYHKMKQKNRLLFVPAGAHLPPGLEHIVPPPGGGLIILPQGFVLNQLADEMIVDQPAAEMIVDQPAAEVVVDQLALVVVQPAEDNVNDQGPYGNQLKGGGGNGAENDLAERIATRLLDRIEQVVVPQVVEGVLVGLGRNV